MERKVFYFLIRPMGWLVSCETGPSLQNGPVHISWKNDSAGWKVDEVTFVRVGNK